MESRIIRKLSKMVLLSGLLSCCCIAHAQPAFLRTDSLSYATTIFHANIGYGISLSKGGESAWMGVDDKNNAGMTYALRLTRCFNQKSIGYGVYVFGYSDRKKHQFSEIPQLKENLRMFYLAPQLSYIKKETAFLNGFGLLGFGVGYLHYMSDTKLQERGNYKTRYDGIGFNVDIGYEYAFHRNWGAKLEVGGIYSPIRPKVDATIENLPVQPRSKINLFLMYLQVGISHYF